MRRRPSSGGEAPVDVVLGDEDAAGSTSSMPLDRPLDRPLDGSLGVPAPAPVDGTSAPGAQVRRRRRRRWATVLLVALVALLAANAVVARRDAARREALERIPGIGRSLERPWAETWRAEGRFAGDLGDRVLLGDVGSATSRAVDVATGRTEWTREAPDGTFREACRLAEVDVGQPASVAVCASSRAEGLAEAADSGSVVAVVDVASGRTLASLDLDRAVIDHGTVDGDVVVVTTDDDRHVAAQRWDVDADEVVWGTTSRQRVVEGGRGWTTTWSSRVLSVQSSQFAVDLRSGQQVPVQYVNDLQWLDVRREALPGGRAVEWPDAVENEVASTTARVLAADGTLERTVEGEPVVPPVDDGSGGEVLLTLSRTGTLDALELATGERAWRASLPAGARPEFVVARVLLVTAGPSVVAVDVRTGEVRWTQTTTDGFRPVTDGSHVLLGRRVDGRAALAAHRLDDGTATWTRELPVGADDVVTLAGGGTVAVGDGLVVGLG